MKWNNRNLVPPGNYKSNPKKPEFDYANALKPYGEGNRGKVWIPVQQIIMNVPETSSSIPVSPTPTPTPSITPTSTLTPTPTTTPTNTPTPSATPPPQYNLLAENTDFILAENGDNINIEN